MKRAAVKKKTVRKGWRTTQNPVLSSLTPCPCTPGFPRAKHATSAFLNSMGWYWALSSIAETGSDDDSGWQRPPGGLNPASSPAQEGLLDPDAPRRHNAVAASSWGIVLDTQEDR